MLRDVMEADGRIDEREDMAIDRVEKIFADELSFSLSRTVAPVGRVFGQLAEGAKSLMPTIGKREEE